jgi:hypothetical protein
MRLAGAVVIDHRVASDAEHPRDHAAPRGIELAQVLDDPPKHLGDELLRVRTRVDPPGHEPGDARVQLTIELRERPPIPGRSLAGPRGQGIARAQQQHRLPYEWPLGS